MSIAMPKPNEALRDFFRNDEIFAAVFNGYFFKGKEVIKAGELKPLDTAYEESVKVNGTKKKQKVNKYRDILRVCSLGILMILGIEDQDKIHYAMPLKNMLYDALQYCSELSVKVDTTNKTEWTADERLSKIPKGTKVTPVCTVVFYTGEKEWDGPRSLYEMMDLDENAKKLVIDYPIYVIDLGHDETLSFPNELLDELRDTLKSAYAKQMDKNKRKIHNSMLSLAGILMNNDELYKQATNNKGGTREMCKALEEIKEEWIQKTIDEKNEEIAALTASKDSIIAALIASKEKQGARIKELEAKLAAKN